MLSALSSAFSSTFSADTRSQIGVAVAKKVLDSAEAEGEAAIQMIEDSAAVADQALRSRPFRVSSSNRGRIAAQPGPGETGRSLDISG